MRLMSILRFFCVLLATLVDAHSSNYDACQFWIENSWFNLQNLTKTDGTFYRGLDFGNKENGIDFNFCRSM